MKISEILKKWNLVEKKMHPNYLPYHFFFFFFFFFFFIFEAIFIMRKCKFFIFLNPLNGVKLFGSIVYIYILNFLKVVVYVIIIDQ